MARRLPNYIRMYRKRSGLTQDEIVSLLQGCKRTSLSRYERHSRAPNLETVFSFSMLFGVPVEKLYAGICQQVTHDLLERVQLLEDELRLSGQRPTPEHQAKLEWLQSVRIRLQDTLKLIAP